MTLESIKKEFVSKDWSHWHSNTSSFRNLPGGTKDEIASFWLSKFSSILEELQREVDKLDSTLNHVYKAEVLELIKNITK